MVVGECMNLKNGFVCSSGKYQNYPCPYQYSKNKCKSAIMVTEDMKRQWDEKGVVTIIDNELLEDLRIEQMEQM